MWSDYSRLLISSLILHQGIHTHTSHSLTQILYTNTVWHCCINIFVERSCSSVMVVTALPVCFWVELYLLATMLIWAHIILLLHLQVCSRHLVSADHERIGERFSDLYYALSIWWTIVIKNHLSKCTSDEAAVKLTGEKHERESKLNWWEVMGKQNGWRNRERAIFLSFVCLGVMLSSHLSSMLLPPISVYIAPGLPSHPNPVNARRKKFFSG